MCQLFLTIVPCHACIRPLKVLETYNNIIIITSKHSYRKKVKQKHAFHVEFISYFLRNFSTKLIKCNHTCTHYFNDHFTS